MGFKNSGPGRVVHDCRCRWVMSVPARPKIGFRCGRGGRRAHKHNDRNSGRTHPKLQILGGEVCNHETDVGAEHRIENPAHVKSSEPVGKDLHRHSQSGAAKCDDGSEALLFPPRKRRKPAGVRRRVQPVQRMGTLSISNHASGIDHLIPGGKCQAEHRAVVAGVRQHDVPTMYPHDVSGDHQAQPGPALAC